MASSLFTTPAKASDEGGNPYSGAVWSFYLTGTLTPVAVYADQGLVTSLGTTVTADAGGKFVPIYLNSGTRYRAILKNASGSDTVYDIDPYNPVVDTGIIHQSDYGTYAQAKTAAGNTKLLVASPQTNTGFTGAKTRPGLVTGHMVIGDSDAFKLEPDAFVGLLAHESYFGDIQQEVRGASYSIDYGRNTADEPVLGWDVIPILGATRVPSTNSFDLLGNMKALVGELIFDKPDSGSRTIRNAYNMQATTYVEENITLTNWYGCVIGEPIHNGAVGGTITNGFGLLINNLAAGGVTFTNAAAIRLAGAGNAGRIWWGNSTWITQDSSSKLEMSLNGTFLSLVNASVAGAANAGADVHLNIIVNGTPCTFTGKAI